MSFGIERILQKLKHCVELEVSDGKLILELFLLLLCLDLLFVSILKLPFRFGQFVPRLLELLERLLL